MKNKSGILIITLIFLFGLRWAYSQNQQPGYITSDTLGLNETINKVIQSHPSVKEIEETINEAKTRTDLARTSYYPNLDLDASFTRLGPVSSISIPNLGSFELYPANNYSASLNINENIFDFGKTSRNVDYQNENIVLARRKLEQVKQSLALATINCYFSIVYLQEAIGINKEQLDNLQQHLDFVTKKKETGSAIQYEILTTQVRISGVESKEIDLESALKIQQSVLNSLLGNPVSRQVNVRNDTTTTPVGIQDDSLVSYAASHRIEMDIAKERTSIAELNYKVIETKNYPSLNFFASGGWKNGYFPDLNTFTANYVAGVGLVFPIFDFGRNKNNLLLAKSTMIEDDFETEVLKRKIENEVTESEENLKSSQKKYSQFELQLSQAEQAYELAEINFRDGAITNLDLLDASTNVSESRLLLLKAKIDFILNTYKLKSAIGVKLY